MSIELKNLSSNASFDLILIAKNPRYNICDQINFFEYEKKIFFFLILEVLKLKRVICGLGALNDMSNWTRMSQK